MLEPLGVDEATLAVYRAFLEHPDESPPQLAARLGHTTEAVSAMLQRLRELDLVVPTWAQPGLEHAVHPRVGLSGLAQRRRNEINRLLGDLEDAEASAETLTEQYNEMLIARTSGDVEVLEGRARAARRIEELGMKARQSSWALIPAHLDDTSADPQQSPDIELIERGVRMRSVYLQSMAMSKAGREYCATIHRAGGEIRTSQTLPMRLLIIDGELAIMRLDPDSPDAGAVVHRSPAVVALALALFDGYWSRSTNPFEAEDLASTSPLTAQEQEVLRLLAGGAKDEQVARLLGISLRTARRITAGLAERLDATSRFELGVAAAKRGWV